MSTNWDSVELVCFFFPKFTLIRYTCEINFYWACIREFLIDIIYNRRILQQKANMQLAIAAQQQKATIEQVLQQFQQGAQWQVALPTDTTTLAQ